MLNESAVQDWLRVHRQLIDMESEFSELAMRAASGEIGLAELAKERERLLAMRALCAAVYDKAFPRTDKP